MEDCMKRPHFSADEEQELLRLAEENRSILENKQSEPIMLKLKEQTWENIAVTFYSNTGIKRSAHSLRVKYDLLKKSKAALRSSKRCPPQPKRSSSDVIQIVNGCQNGEMNKSNDSIQMDSPKRARVDTINLVPPEQLLGLNPHIVQSNPIKDNGQSQPNPDGATNALPIIAPVLYNIKTIDLTDQLQHEKLLLLRAQRFFCEQENIRAQEKHTLEMESLRAKRELLLMEISEKKQGRKS
ncbi:uncharacterized protein Dana_GF27501, isoform B [Drosophila ananassae]|uniref:Regulatory protein zeste n=1 Tax=Drosophila ananassae TaxID=7217 RepID=A0A0P9C5T6_DROAN|nr:uncharacterized protein LOC26514910 [Drosophila ananassae]XP_014765682.1 uncharacterized protein LOC26514910 [Drosophila ananassae]KPU79018.1 uncharacterized protein Dana_GF27501, isoform A [Drosophila ananassae]KPU79019.1 uncharacterized protein Dana_GF27501, isoform B [Drosophila ananassae]